MRFPASLLSSVSSNRSDQTCGPLRVDHIFLNVSGRCVSFARTGWSGRMMSAGPQPLLKATMFPQKEV